MGGTATSAFASGAMWLWGMAWPGSPWRWGPGGFVAGAAAFGGSPCVFGWPGGALWGGCWAGAGGGAPAFVLRVPPCGWVGGVGGVWPAFEGYWLAGAPWFGFAGAGALGGVEVVWLWGGGWTGGAPAVPEGWRWGWL